MWRSVLLAGAEGGLLVVFTRVDNLTLGALPDQVSAHPGNILKTMTWRRAEDRRTDETKNLFYKLSRKFRLLVFQRLLFFLFFFFCDVRAETTVSTVGRRWKRMLGKTPNDSEPTFHCE